MQRRAKKQAKNYAFDPKEFGILTKQIDLSLWIRLKSQRDCTQSIAVKNSFIAYLLWFLGGFGVLGLHRFYLGRWISGLLWLFTGGLFLFGAIIDLFLIPEMVRVENLAGHFLHQANDRRYVPNEAPRTGS